MSLKLIDTHCHLTDERLTSQLAGVLARARAAGLGAIVCATSSVSDASAAAELAAGHEGVCWTAGVHPHQAKDPGGDYLRRIEELLARPGGVAVGEIGLDYHYDFSPRQLQRRVFAEQLDLAGRLGRPAVVHTREAFDEAVAIIADSTLPGERVVFHSFTGGPAEARRALDLGACVSFSGIATFRNAAEIRQAAALVPDGRILIETDAPYLSPEPVRKMKLNEPANLVHVARCLAAVRKAPVEAFAELTTANAVRFFGLGGPG